MTYRNDAHWNSIRPFYMPVDSAYIMLINLFGNKIKNNSINVYIYTMHFVPLDDLEWTQVLKGMDIQLAETPSYLKNETNRRHFQQIRHFTPRLRSWLFLLFVVTLSGSFTQPLAQLRDSRWRHDMESLSTIPATGIFRRIVGQRTTNAELWCLFIISLNEPNKHSGYRRLETSWCSCDSYNHTNGTIYWSLINHM